MQLIDRYILAVKDALPTDQKEEIGRELKSNLLDEVDAIDQQNHSQNNASTDERLTKVLTKYGSPVLTAQRYYQEPALVAGIDMPLFKKILSHASAALFVFVLLETIVSMLHDDSINPFRLIFQSFFLFIDKVAWVFLIITIGFYYLGKHNNLSQRLYANWSIDKLPKSALLKIKVSDTITDLITNSFVLLLLWTPLWMHDTLQQQQVLSLAPEYEYWRIILTVLCVQSLAQALYRFVLTYWNKKVCLAYLIDLLLFAFAALFLASSDSLLVLNPEALIQDGRIAIVLENITQTANYVFLVIASVLFVLAFFQFKKYRQLS